MGIFDRMGRVISANFNSVLDKLEDPKKSLEQTLNEMREQIRAARQEVVRAVASEKQLRGKVEELDKEVEKWDKRAELAVQKDDDDLAREAIVQKRRVVGDRDRAEALRAEQRGAALEMKQELERMEQKVKEVEARKGTIAAQVQQARAGGGPEGLGARGGSEGGAFGEFRRMEDQIEAVETTVQAQRELDDVLNPKGPSGLSRSEVEAKFRALESGAVPAAPGAAPVTEVDQELEQLKKRVRVKI
ncbi:MAG TPA: PspA/IM30 family protein [Polyangiaceae bacterium]|nr:PspA/IM30 family protein [Polyangiaceae bacterium]